MFDNGHTARSVSRFALVMRYIRESAILFALYMAPAVAHTLGAGAVAPDLNAILALAFRNAAFGLVVFHLIDLRGESNQFFPSERIFSVQGLLIALFTAAMLFGIAVITRTLFSLFSVPATRVPPIGAGDPPGIRTLILVPTMVVIAYVEELFFRVYLLTRFRQARLKTYLAVGGTALLFALGHGWQGTEAIVFSFFAGVGLGLVWVTKRRFHPLALGHALYNLAAFLITLA